LLLLVEMMWKHGKEETFRKPSRPDDVKISRVR
jgi:hypothetical protein